MTDPLNLSYAVLLILGSITITPFISALIDCAADIQEGGIK
jgi:hypothetical protein